MLSIFLILLSVFSHSGTSLKGELDNYLKKNLTGYKDYQYEIIQMPENYKEATLLKTNELNLSGNLAYIPVKVVTKRNRTTKSFITVKLKLFREVLVAVKEIKYKEALLPSDFQFEKIDVTQVRGTPVNSLKGIETLRSKLSMRAGDVLINEGTEIKPVINVGDPVKASVVDGSVYVSTEAFARQEGIPGEIIQVMTKNKKLFKAKVIDSRNVLIIE